MKQKYTFTIEEAISQDFSVYAASAEEAYNSVINKYKLGEFVLDPGFVTHRQISSMEPELLEWTEF